MQVAIEVSIRRRYTLKASILCLLQPTAAKIVALFISFHSFAGFHVITGSPIVQSQLRLATISFHLMTHNLITMKLLNQPALSVCE